jgi:hypothetical protein
VRSRSVQKHNKAQRDGRTDTQQITLLAFVLGVHGEGCSSGGRDPPTSPKRPEPRTSSRTRCKAASTSRNLPKQSRLHHRFLLLVGTAGHAPPLLISVYLPFFPRAMVTITRNKSCCANTVMRRSLVPFLRGEAKGV